MGCDIHVHREVRCDGQWKCLEDYYEDDGEVFLSARYIDRNYMLFGLLAEVRSKVSLAFTARGLPDDVSEQIQLESNEWDSDGHTHSWLDLRELHEKQTELLLSSEQLTQECLTCLQKFLGELEWPKDVSPQNCRIVFWFDN